MNNSFPQSAKSRLKSMNSILPLELVNGIKCLKNFFQNEGSTPKVFFLTRV